MFFELFGIFFLSLHVLSVHGLKSTIPGTSCEQRVDCIEANLDDPNIICGDQMCRCQANFHWDPQNNECKPYVCAKDTDCQEYDPFRRCVNDTTINPPGKKCLCNHASTQSSTDKKCYPRISGDCQNHDDCRGTNDLNTYCVAKKCRCKINFQFDEMVQHKCVQTACKIARDCEEVDPNRDCLAGKCVCKKNFKEALTDDLCHEIF